MAIDIENNMPPDELIYWVAYFELENAREKKEEAQHKRESEGNPKTKRFR